MVICAEYDALPEVGHACGHNIIATAALGAGVALVDAANELGFRIRVQGTPAEEAYGGKVDLINNGAFTGAALSMMIHPSPADVVDPNFLGVAHIDVEFTGKESHAAFAPQLANQRTRCSSASLCEYLDAPPGNVSNGQSPRRH